MRVAATIGLWALVTAVLMHGANMHSLSDMAYCLFVVTLPRGWFE